jgi:uncharacterized membrane protein YesL
MKFLSIDSPLMVFLGKVADLMWVNILTILCCIPVITGGAAFTAMHYVCLKIVRDEECYITKDYFKSFKQNFRQATVIWLIMLALFAVYGADFYLIYTKAVEFPTWMNSLFLGVVILTFLVIIMVFPVLAKFDDSLKQILKISALAAVAQLPKTVLSLIVIVAPFVLGIYIYQIIPVVILLGLAVPAFVCALMYNKLFLKIEERHAETNPAPEEEPEDDGVRIFSDTPILPPDEKE